MKTIYYIPINSGCLAHYFGSACILPSRYIQNRPIDIQSKYTDSLLLTKNNGILGADCYLEVVLIQSEMNELVKLDEDVLLLNKPLPISRVKKVLFSDKSQCERTISNIEISTAFIPKSIVEIRQLIAVTDINKLQFDKSMKVKDWDDEIGKYDSLLGGMALMQLSGDDNMNFSEHYFSTLAFFNDVIVEELKINNKTINPLYHDAFIGISSFKILYKYLYGKMSDNDLEEIAIAENQKIERDKITRIIDLSKLDRASYIVAVLNTYGTSHEAKKKKIDSLILSNFKSEINAERSEVISLCYGLNRGYSAFNNIYKSGTNRKNVKFKLQSQLDYYTIESIYQFAFNKQKSGGFPYLDIWCPKAMETNSKGRNKFKILDVTVIGKNKPKVKSQAYLLNLLNKLFQKDVAKLQDAFIEKIRDVIYEDTIEECSELVELKEEEIQILKEQLARRENYKNDVKESTKVDGNNNNTLVEERVIEALKLKNLTVAEFKKIAKKYNIKIEKVYKDKEDRDKLIIEILNQSIQEIPFN